MQYAKMASAKAVRLTGKEMTSKCKLREAER